MPAARFFALAYRLAAYDGMLTRRVEAQRERDRSPDPAPSGAKPAAAQTRSRANTTTRPAVRTKQLANAEVVPVGAMAMAFPGLIERTRVSPDLVEMTRAPTAAPDGGSAPPVEAPPTES